MAQTNCTLDAGYELGCINSAGGLKSIYIGNWSSDIEYTEDADNVITGITAGITALYKYDLVAETAGISENIMVSRENGTIYFEQNISLIINELAATLRNQVLLLAAATIVIIAEDLNGNFFTVGKERGANVLDGTSGTGILIGDRSGTALNFQAKESKSMHFIEFSAFSSLIA